MESLKAVKALSHNLSRILMEITEEDFLSDLQFSMETPKDQGQYWEYEISILHEDLNKPSLHKTCGFFVGTGLLRNIELDINYFYSNNDKLVEEIFFLYEKGVFNKLISVLKEYEVIIATDYSISLNINSYVTGGNERLKQICEEYMLILHSDEKENIYLGTQQNERIRIKLIENNELTYLTIPFDKSRYFQRYEITREYKYSRENDFKYDVALSFAGENREYVFEVSDTLKRFGVKVFYDEYEKVSLWGKDLYTHLDDIYRNKSKYCVMFISEHYKSKVWANHERESAQARAFHERKEYILPVRFDETEIPGVRPTTGYLDANKTPPISIAQSVLEKLKQQ